MSGTTTETQKDQTTWRDKTLKAAGASYMLGDAAMVTAGLARSQNPGEKWLGTVAGAATWFLGGVAAAVWGNPDADKQLEIQASKLQHYLKQKGVSVPDDVRAQSKLLKKKSFLGHVSEFLYEHPSEMLNTAYAIGSVMLLHDGWNNRSNKSFLPKSLNPKVVTETMNTDFWIGALILAGSSIGLLVKEDPNAREKAEGKGALQKAYAYVAEKPLRVTGALYGLNNGFLAAKAYNDHSKRADYSGKLIKPHYASVTQLAAYLFSNAMLFFSNREQTSSKGFEAENITKLEDAAARILAAQAPEKQKELLADVSNYMASQKGISMKAPEIARTLADRIASLTQERLQPAVEQAKWAAREAARVQDENVDISR